jgi:P-type conjugative transfer protein TrbJ
MYLTRHLELSARVSCFLSSAVLATVLALVPVRFARAQLGSGIVFDPTNFARNVLHYTRRLEQMDLQRQQLQQQLAAMRKLPNPPWRDIAQTVAQVNALMADGRALAYELADLENQFHATFPVDRSFHDWPTERRAQAQRTISTMSAALSGARTQAQGFNDGLDRLSQMKSQVGSVPGHEAALELQNTATVFTAEELMLLRQALMAQTSMQAVYYADRVNTDAQQATTVEEHLTDLSGPARRTRPISLRVENP